MGNIRVMKNDLAIYGISLEIIQDHNEIVNHFLKIFVFMNIRKKGVLSKHQIKEGLASFTNPSSTQCTENGSDTNQHQQNSEMNKQMRDLIRRDKMMYVHKESTRNPYNN